MKKLYKLIFAVIAVSICTMALSSCDTASTAAFNEGWRQGWNATTPSDYHY